MGRRSSAEGATDFGSAIDRAVASKRAGEMAEPADGREFKTKEPRIQRAETKN